MSGEIECEKPNAAIYNFEGSLDYKGKTYGLEVDNLLLRGMSIKNTECLFGLVVFTGHETKVMKNSEDAIYKLSRLEILSNKTIQLIFVIQVCMALLFGIMSYFIQKGIYDYTDTPLCDEESAALCNGVKGDALKACLELKKNLCRDHYYLGIDEEPSFALAMRNTGTWILFMTNLVPISLVVTLEMVKFFQA